MEEGIICWTSNMGRGKQRDSYRIMKRKALRKYPDGRLKKRWEHNINLDIQEMVVRLKRS